MAFKRVSRRDFLSRTAKTSAALALGSAFSGFLEGCGSSGSKESSVIAVEIDEGQNALPFQWFNPDMKKKFGVTTKILGLPFVGQYEKIVSELVTKSSVYDVLVFPPQFLGDFVAKGFLRPLTDYGKVSDFNLSDIIPAYRDPYMKRNGKYYAATYDGDILQVTYRKDLFDAAGLKPATTWDEFVALAKELHKPPAQYGNAFLAARGFCYAWFINIFAGLGGHWFTSDMKAGFNSDAGVKALETLVTLKQYAPPNILQIGYPELNTAYLNGSTAMVIQWDDLAMKAEDPSLSKVVGKNAYAGCPVRTYMPYSRVMAISAYSKNPNNSFKVIQYMDSYDASVRENYDPKCGEDPFRYSTLKPSLVKDHTGKPTMPPAQAKSYVDGIRSSLVTGYPELSIPGAPRYLDTLDLRVNQALAGSSTPAQAIKAAAAAWDKITNSLGQSNQQKAYQDWIASFHAAGVKY